MVPAVISVVFGLASFLSLPVVVPVIGLALGANSYIKEREKAPEAQQKEVKVVSIIGAVCCSLPVLVLLIGSFLMLR